MKILLSTVVLLTLMTTEISTGHASMLEVRQNNFWPSLSARPFEDVPQGHWSYSALSKLVLISQLDESHIPRQNRPVTRYEFAVVIWRCNDALDSTERSRAKDLLVALNYEYAFEMMDVISKPRGDERLSLQDEKELAIFDEAIKRNLSESTPDQWSDFLQQGVKVPIRTATQPVIEGRDPFTALPGVNSRFFRRPNRGK